MNCEKCQGLLSGLLDGGLDADVRAGVRAHLEECWACASVREELSIILGAAHDGADAFAAPPNERALWLRIRNSIEGEAEAARRAAAARAAAAARQSVWSRLAGKRWSLTLPQLATVAAGVAVAVALATATGMRAMIDGRRAEEARAVQPVRFKQKPDELLRIDYLKRRVEERKARWNPRMSEAYDRNMSVVDMTVEELIRDLDARPHDEVTEEALKSALRDKIELLKEISEL
jgi:hypothetical protein